MKHFDVIVIGAGTGLDLASYASKQGMKVALIEEGPMGGTCLNRGCIPSKMLIHSSDVAEIIRNSKKFGITAEIKDIDFSSIVKRVSNEVDKDSTQIETAIKQDRNITLYKLKGKFIGYRTMKVGDETVKGEKVFIVAGTRPRVPKFPGIDKVKYLTSQEALRLKNQPKHLVVVGGGYIGMELAHFFGGLGSKVTIVYRGSRLLKNEDSEISNRFTGEFSKKYKVLFSTNIVRLEQRGRDIIVSVKEAEDKESKIVCDQILMATGRVPNTDILDVSQTGVKIDKKGYIEVNEYLETSTSNIWALGDIVGILPFKHTANHQVRFVIRNAFFENKLPVDYSAIAHAVFSSPQVAGVGFSEDELKDKGISYRVGRYEYKDTGMGAALQDNGLVKVLVEKESDKILGVHIIGHEASTLIHEAVVAMKTTGNASAITESVFVHPALSEVLQRAFYNI